jgi:regulator of replication initiation timing
VAKTGTTQDKGKREVICRFKSGLLHTREESMYQQEYAVVQETDLQQMQDKMNRLAKEGWLVCNAYGIPDHRSHSHVVWMIRTVINKEKP